MIRDATARRLRNRRGWLHRLVCRDDIAAVEGDIPVADGIQLGRQVHRRSCGKSGTSKRALCRGSSQPGVRPPKLAIRL